MAQHGSREQKRLAKKKAKRADRLSPLAHQTMEWMDRLLRSGAGWPIIEALVPENLFEDGIGNLVIARRVPDGRIAYANYLVDIFCLGVKDAFCKVVPTFEYLAMRRKLDHISREMAVAPEFFAKLVADAINFAGAIGFSPHPDYESARLLLAGIESSLCTQRFEFGRDGKPLYIQGPHDSAARAAAIVARVQAAGGHFIVNVSQLSAGGFDVRDAALGDLSDNEEPSGP